MRTEIKLSYNNGFKWFSFKGIYTKGYLFDSNNNLYEDELLVKYFDNINTAKEFKQKLIEANGIFSVIIKQDTQTFVAVDKTRTFPLFYAQSDDLLYISDNTNFLKKANNSHIDNESKQIFLSAGMVTGSRTLLKGVLQVEAGEYIKINNSLERDFYSEYFPVATKNIKYNILKKDLREILEKSIKRLITFANGKQIVIPLSGGYDSRVVATLLQRYNYKNVICFTYGKENSFEVEISKKVAKKLGYKWYFIEYNNQLISNDYINESLFLEYISFAFNHVSKPHLQDYFAVKYLMENNLIDKDTIFATGHSGDFLGGSHYLAENKITKSNIISNLKNKHFIYNSIDFDINKILNYIKVDVEIEYYYSVADNFNLKERQAKFIINANRVYEFFNYYFTMPLWDNALIDFFKEVPLEYKLNSILYEEVLHEIFKEYNVDFLKKDAKYKKNFFKDKIKLMIPLRLKQKMIKRIVNKNFEDINNFRLYTEPFFTDLEIFFEYSSIEDIYIQWCISKMEKYNG